jgi:hypothetical protein
MTLKSIIKWEKFCSYFKKILRYEKRDLKDANNKFYPRTMASMEIQKKNLFALEALISG